MYQIRKMRLPTSAEWNHLIEITGGFDSRIHWSSAWTLCQNAVEDFVSYVVRGYISSDCYSTCRGSVIDEKFGFRPAFVVSGAEEIDRDGQLVPVGALYVNGYPLRVPPEPVLGQDIPDYIFGSNLEFCPGKETEILKAYLGKGPGCPFFGDILVVIRCEERFFELHYRVWRAKQRPADANRLSEIQEFRVGEFQGLKFLERVDTDFGRRAFWLYTPACCLDDDALTLRAVAKVLKQYSVSNQLCARFRRENKNS